jgi:hypothetical protein
MYFLQTNKRDKNIQLIMAIFRDIMIYKEMANALIIDYNLRLNSFKKRLERLENNDG